MNRRLVVRRDVRAKNRAHRVVQQANTDEYGGGGKDSSFVKTDRKAIVQTSPPAEELVQDFLNDVDRGDQSQAYWPPIRYHLGLEYDGVFSIE